MNAANESCLLENMLNLSPLLKVLLSNRSHCHHE